MTFGFVCMAFSIQRYLLSAWVGPMTGADYKTYNMAEINYASKCENLVYL